MYSFNLLVSYGHGLYRDAEREIKEVLSKLGDESPFILRTFVSGIAGVTTKLNSREVIAAARKTYLGNPLSLQAAIKWVPTDNWCPSDLEDMEKKIDELKNNIAPEERWAMVVEKRRYQQYHTDDIISTLAQHITNKVDLHYPQKILRIDILGSQAAISVLQPHDIFSIGKQRDFMQAA